MIIAGIMISLLRPYIMVLTSSTMGSQQTKRGRKASLFNIYLPESVY